MQGSHSALTGPAITMTEAAGLIGEMVGKRPSSATVWRWAMKGVRGVRLESLRVGGTLYTTRAWVLEFLAASQSSAVKVGPREVDARCSPRNITVAGPRVRQASRDHAKQSLDRLCNPLRK